MPRGCLRTGFALSSRFQGQSSWFLTMQIVLDFTGSEATSLIPLYVDLALSKEVSTLFPTLHGAVEGSTRGQAEPLAHGGPENDSGQPVGVVCVIPGSFGCRRFH